MREGAFGNVERSADRFSVQHLPASVSKAELIIRMDHDVQDLSLYVQGVGKRFPGGNRTDIQFSVFVMNTGDFVNG